MVATPKKSMAVIGCETRGKLRRKMEEISGRNPEDRKQTDQNGTVGNAVTRGVSRGKEEAVHLSWESSSSSTYDGIESENRQTLKRTPNERLEGSFQSNSREERGRTVIREIAQNKATAPNTGCHPIQSKRNATNTKEGGGAGPFHCVPVSKG